MEGWGCGERCNGQTYLSGGPKEPPWLGEKKLAWVLNSAGVRNEGKGLVFPAVTQARAAP